MFQLIWPKSVAHYHKVECHSMGVDDMIDAYQSAYDRYSERYAEAKAAIEQ